MAVGAISLVTSAYAQTATLIYICGFDQPPYGTGTINGQQGWTTAQANAVVAVPEMAIVAFGGPGAQSGTGFFSSTSGPSSSTSGRFAYQAADTSTPGANPPLIHAIKEAETSGATAIEFSAYITAPTPALSGTSNVGARHGMVLYVRDPSGTITAVKAACGFQVRAFDRQILVVQWLDVGQLGVITAGNYLINFTTPLLVEATGYTQVGCRWNRETGMPAVRAGTGEWTDMVATSTIGYTAIEFDIVNTRGSTAGGAVNTVSTQAFMDSLSVWAVNFPPPADLDGDGVPDGVDNCLAAPNPTQADCDGNGIGDACQAGFEDFNGNGVPDYCECIADLFVDGQINGADLGALLSQWGPALPSTVSDLNRDGVVNGADLGYLLSNWGRCMN
jgi:hypothetical protein